MGRPTNERPVVVASDAEVADRQARQLALRLRCALLPDKLAPSGTPRRFPASVHAGLATVRAIEDPHDRLAALLDFAATALPLIEAVDGGGPHSISRDVARIVNRAREAQEGRTA